MAVDVDPRAAAPSLPAAARQGFEQLRRQFVDGLPGRMHEIGSALDPQDRHQALHRLVGAAGSYGFASLSQAARAADALTGAADAPAYRSAWAALQECVALARGEMGPPGNSIDCSRSGDTNP